jgi:hypothetical protein
LVAKALQAGPAWARDEKEDRKTHAVQSPQPLS